MASEPSGYHFSPFEVGQVKAHLYHGLSALAISRIVVKSDGKTHWSENAVQKIIDQLEGDRKYRGERKQGSGAKRLTTEAQDKRMIKWVLKERGEQKVTVKVIKKQFPFLRKLGNTAIEDRLHGAELYYMRRRNKPIVTKEYLASRVSYCRGVKRKHQDTLDKWAYTDGTTFFLARSQSEHDHTVQRALGTHVWKKADNREALFEECIGPSSYSKGQGLPVRVWGMLAGGVLNIYIVPEGEVIDKALYVDLIEDYFDDWAGNCEHLVCDFEWAIRSEDALLALSQSTSLTLVPDYPKCSQDFNAIENAWHILRERLDVTVPKKLESRQEFIDRLTAAVRWANQHRASQLWGLCRDQKKRADECLSRKPLGARTSY